MRGVGDNWKGGHRILDLSSQGTYCNVSGQPLVWLRYSHERCLTAGPLLAMYDSISSQVMVRTLVHALTIFPKSLASFTAWEFSTVEFAPISSCMTDFSVISITFVAKRLPWRFMQFSSLSICRLWMEGHWNEILLCRSASSCVCWHFLDDCATSTVWDPTHDLKFWQKVAIEGK